MIPLRVGTCRETVINPTLFIMQNNKEGKVKNEIQI